MLNKFVVATLLVFCVASNAVGGITSATVDSGSFIIYGASFGTKEINHEWLGPNIENGNSGQPFQKTKWGADTQSTERQAPVYTNTRSHSGAKSILSELPIQTQYSSGFFYDNGETFDSIYASYWVYFDHVDSLGQWKMWRIRPTHTNIYGDMNGEIMTSQWYTVDGLNHQNYVLLYCNYLSYAQCYPGGVSNVYGGADDIITPGMWIRVEIYAKGSSSDGQNDGRLYYTITRNGEVTHVMRDYSNIITRLPGSEKWRHFVFENYWGNIGAGGGNGTLEKMYFDDIFIQFNTRARIEIGNNAVFANCTHREIQPALTWSDTGITGTFNQGSFNNGDTVYFFVVDEDGIPSDGYPVTIGGDPLTANPVVEILTESGQTTTASILTITGTATADTGQTISGVTCSGQTVTPDDGTWDEQEEAFTCLANLAIGENTLVFVGSDGTRTGSDSVAVTRTAAPQASITNTSVSHGVLRH